MRLSSNPVLLMDIKLKKRTVFNQIYLQKFLHNKELYTRARIKLYRVYIERVFFFPTKKFS